MSSLRAAHPAQFAAGATTTIARRALATYSKQTSPLAATVRPNALAVPRSTALVRQFQRAYADAAPTPRPGKIRRTFKWLWRLTYLSVFGTLGFIGYTVYEDRNPHPQSEPDPTKKTLVVLGMRHP